MPTSARRRKAGRRRQRAENHRAHSRTRRRPRVRQRRNLLASPSPKCTLARHWRSRLRRRALRLRPLPLTPGPAHSRWTPPLVAILRESSNRRIQLDAFTHRDLAGGPLPAYAVGRLHSSRSCGRAPTGAFSWTPSLIATLPWADSRPDNPPQFLLAHPWSSRRGPNFYRRFLGAHASADILLRPRHCRENSQSAALSREASLARHIAAGTVPSR